MKEVGLRHILKTVVLYALLAVVLFLLVVGAVTVFGSSTVRLYGME